MAKSLDYYKVKSDEQLIELMFCDDWALPKVLGMWIRLMFEHNNEVDIHISVLKDRRIISVCSHRQHVNKHYQIITNIDAIEIELKGEYRINLVSSSYRYPGELIYLPIACINRPPAILMDNAPEEETQLIMVRFYEDCLKQIDTQFAIQLEKKKPYYELTHNRNKPFHLRKWSL